MSDPRNGNESDWILKKRVISYRKKQIETKVQRKIILEDGVMIEDSGPEVTTKTVEDLHQEFDDIDRFDDDDRMIDSKDFAISCHRDTSKSAPVNRLNLNADDENYHKIDQKESAKLIKVYFGGLKEDLKRSKFEPNQRCISESINSSPNYLTNGKTRILITQKARDDSKIIDEKFDDNNNDVGKNQRNDLSPVKYYFGQSFSQ
ncbi:hypothetical protein SSS_05236 [Sarcoptes scabiei]|uniref:Uncharacterized protein n=1 Tax=Sarcoptes scabiei TaxID=52283 RepID=A0A834R254_SARSC|nr:hypothetical protein SSS_05236 [Sarcoptes scabiei]